MRTAVASPATAVQRYMPARNGGPTPLESVRRRARSARDDAYYDKCYAMQLVMAGDLSKVDQLIGGGGPSYAGDPDLGDYPDIDPPLGPYGVQNHLLIDSRINVMGIVFSDPEFLLEHPNQLVKQVNRSFLRQRWKAGDWANEFYEVGMDVQAAGIGFVEVGIRDGAVAVAHRPMLDVLYDPVYRSPKDWRYVFIRRRIDIDDAIAEYGHLYTPDELVKMARPVKTNRGGQGQGVKSGEALLVIHEWSYWDQSSHCKFLGQIQTSDPLYLDEAMSYRRGKVGANPFLTIPVVPWIESWAPGVKRPTGRVETSWRMAVMLMAYETYIREILLKGPPLNIMSTIGLQPDQVRSLKESVKRGFSNLEKIITVDGVGDVKNTFLRIPAAEVPQSLVMAREMMKQELNASSGVMDTQRGQEMPGERTATEVRSLNASQGVQARHTRKQYARFLEQLTYKVRTIAALYDRVPTVLQLEDSQFDTSRLPLAPMLSEAMNVEVQENSLVYLTQDDLEQRRLVEFNSVDLVGVQLGVNDPYKVIESVYTDLGRRDPTTRMKDPQQYMAEQQQSVMARVMAAQATAAGANPQVSGSDGTPHQKGGGSEEQISRAQDGRDKPADSPQNQSRGTSRKGPPTRELTHA